MNYLTPDQATQAREQLNLSQARVARDTGINRPYLSQFESSKRILSDEQLNTLHEYFTIEGWKTTPESEALSTEQLINSDKHSLTIADGFVVTDSVSPHELDNLLDEYYRNAEEIIECSKIKLNRGLFGGLDQDTARDQCIRSWTLMARQQEIILILHGQPEQPNPDMNTNDSSTVKTVGDYIEALLKLGIPERETAACEVVELD